MSKQRKIGFAFPPAKHRYSVIEKFSEAIRLFWKWDGNFRDVYEVRSHKTKSHSLLCFSCLTFDGYQLNVIEITGFFLHTRGLLGASFTPTWNWINKFDYRYVTKFIPTYGNLSASTSTPADMKFLSNQIGIVIYCLNWPICELFYGGLAEWCSMHLKLEFS